jgi:hypothetical protein
VRRVLAATVIVALALLPAAADSGPIRHACRDQSFHRPVASNGRPPQGVLKSLAVLRHGRPARLDFSEFYPLHRVAVHYVRRLAKGYYLVPATLRPSDLETPVLCRKPTPRGADRGAERKHERRALHSFGLYLVSVSSDGGFNTPHGLGVRRHALLDNRLTYAYGDDRHTWLSGVVPDGVASVRLTFAGRSHTRRAARNFWVVRLNESTPPDELDHTTIEWLAADGSVERTFHGS